MRRREISHKGIWVAVYLLTALMVQAEGLNVVNCWSVKANPGEYVGQEISFNLILYGDRDSFERLEMPNREDLVSFSAKAWRNRRKQTVFVQTEYPVPAEIYLVASPGWVEAFLTQHQSTGPIAYKVTGTVEKIPDGEHHFYIIRISNVTRGYYGGCPDMY